MPRAMKTFAFVLLVALATAGCRKKEEAVPDPGSTALVAVQGDDQLTVVALGDAVDLAGGPDDVVTLDLACRR